MWQNYKNNVEHIIVLHKKSQNFHIFQEGFNFSSPSQEKLHFNPIRPGRGGGSEARMTKLTAANQKPLYSLMLKLGDF